MTKKEQKKSVPKDTVSSDDDNEERKTGSGASREPLEGSKKEFKNKGSLAESKIANKRKQKEAIKKNKLKRGKGVAKHEQALERKEAAGAAEDIQMENAN